MKTKVITNKIKQQFCIDAEDKYMERCLLNKGYQIKNWEFAQTLLSDFNTALDVGASIGMNSINYANTFNTVYSFEPDIDVYECLCETVTMNNCDNVITYNSAISDNNNNQILVKFPRATFANTLKPLKYKGRTRPQLNVNCATIDSFNFDNVSFIKIDVEGWEFSVLKGAEQTIKKQHPLIQVELKPQMLIRSNTTPQDVIDYMGSLNYEYTHYKDHDDLEFTDTKILCNGNNLVDFWFIWRNLNK